MFHLPFPIPPSPVKIQLGQSLVTMGSCFAASMGEKLAESKFDVMVNPFGTVYNPVSLSEILMDHFTDEAVENQGIWYAWQAHGEVSAASRAELEKILSQKRTDLQAKLKTASWLVLTLGSAFAYRLKKTGNIVANCHKIPQQEFEKISLTPDEISICLNQAMDHLKKINTKLNFLLTVSPVRHVRDGLVENNQSKAALIQATHQLVKVRNDVHYFPAYEIMLDELRDYRFYGPDRVHPSEEAIGYIWMRFRETCFDEQTNAFLDKWAAISQSLQHKAFHPHSEPHQKFLKNLLKQLEEISGELDVQSEMEAVKKQIR
jgi:lysophospholipase L1-like esterase